MPDTEEGKEKVSFGTKFNNAMNSDMGKSVIGAAGSIASMIPNKRAAQNDNQQMLTKIQDQAFGAMMKSGNPWVMAAGAVMTGFQKTGGLSWK